MQNIKDRRFRLDIALVLLFVLQLTGTVGLVSYLSFRSGQKAVNDLAGQLHKERTARIEEKLIKYLGSPHDFNQLNGAAFSENSFDMVNASNAKQFRTEVQISTFISASYCGDSQGQYLGASRLFYKGSKTAIAMSVSNQESDYNFYLYTMDSRGNRQQLLEKRGPFDPRQRPWYTDARKAKRQNWTGVYLDFATGLFTITASEPVYDSTGNILGVCATDVVLLEDLRKFLGSLAIGKTGHAFIMDRKGSMLSSSTNEPLTVGKGENAKLVMAIQSEEPVVRETAQYLQQHFGSFDRIERSQQGDYLLNGKRQFVQVSPLKDGKGIDWLIAVVIPEADFMAQIYENTQNTSVLVLIALLVAIAIGILTARWITHPLLKLAQASQEVARGNLDQKVDAGSIKEIAIVANSFNSMTDKLKESVKALRLANEELENRVEIRTAELRKEKERSEQLLLNILPAKIAERLKGTESPTE